MRLVLQLPNHVPHGQRQISAFAARDPARRCSNYCTGTRLTPLFEAVRKDPSRAQTLASVLNTLRSSPVPPAFGKQTLVQLLIYELGDTHSKYYENDRAKVYSPITLLSCNNPRNLPSFCNY